MKSGSKALAIALLFVGLVLVNYLASSIPARLDATAESIYSLSSGTKALLGKVEEPITLNLYFSKDATGLPIAYKNYATRVSEMLRQYVRASHGKLTLNVINPQPDTPEEEKATASGLTPQVSQQGGQQFFVGLVVIQADQQKNIPAFTPQREQFLEYDLSKLIYSVQQLDKRKLGLLTSLPLQGSSPQDMQMMMMMRRQPQPSQMIRQSANSIFRLSTAPPGARAAALTSSIVWRTAGAKLVGPSSFTDGMRRRYVSRHSPTPWQPSPRMAAATASLPRNEPAALSAGRSWKAKTAESCVCWSPEPRGAREGRGEGRGEGKGGKECQQRALSHACAARAWCTNRSRREG